jgi:hypothetical protein
MTTTDRDDANRDALEQAVDLAAGGNMAKLYALLTRGSKLPGVRPNLDLAERFGAVCAARGKAGEALATKLALLDPDTAPGATELEFLPMCGVVAAGARAVSDPGSAKRMLEILEAASEDLRFRVRDVVPPALARIGALRGEALLAEVDSWMTGFFPATAVLLAMTRLEWLSKLDDAVLPLSRLEQAFVLARNAERSAERYPGYKALIVALGTCPMQLAARFGPPAFDVLVRMSDIKEPMLREAIAKNLDSHKLARRFATEITRVKQALEATAPVARDPRSNVGPTRRRGRRGR